MSVMKVRVKTPVLWKPDVDESSGTDVCSVSTAGVCSVSLHKDLGKLHSNATNARTASGNILESVSEVFQVGHKVASTCLGHVDRAPIQEKVLPLPCLSPE